MSSPRSGAESCRRHGSPPGLVGDGGPQWRDDAVARKCPAFVLSWWASTCVAPSSRPSGVARDSGACAHLALLLFVSSQTAVRRSTSFAAVMSATVARAATGMTTTKTTAVANAVRATWALCTPDPGPRALGRRAADAEDQEQGRPQDLLPGGHHQRRPGPRRRGPPHGDHQLSVEVRVPQRGDAAEARNRGPRSPQSEVATLAGQRSAARAPVLFGMRASVWRAGTRPRPREPMGRVRVTASARARAGRGARAARTRARARPARLRACR